MLDIYPKMLPRLDEIEDDLQGRRSRAAHEGWLGEVEGLDLTLTYLHQTRTDETADPHRPSTSAYQVSDLRERHELCAQAAEGNRVPQRYRQVVRTFSQARAVRP